MSKYNLVTLITSGGIKIPDASKYACLVFGPIRHKVIEFQISRWADGARFDFDFTYRDKHLDHSGMTFDVTLFGIEFTATFYDTRHAEAREPRGTNHEIVEHAS